MAERPFKHGRVCSFSPRQVVSLQTGLTQYHYDEVGNLRGTIYPNGVNVWHDYDPCNRLTNMVWRRLTAPIESYAYTLAPTGHRLAAQEGNGRRVSYQYDNHHRLTRETLLSGTLAGAIDYTHDPVGNRLSRNSTLAPILSKLYEYNQNDWLDSDGYDANGNTIAADNKQFAYDYENRILSATSAASAVTIQYDGDGNRVGKTVTDALGTHTTQYLVDDRNPTGYAQVLEELSNNEATRAYTYGLALIAQSGATNLSLLTSYFCTDGHGNTRFLTDNAGTITDTYDVFGQRIEHTGATPNNYLYCGEQFDPDLGLYFLRVHYMDADRGRFWTMDTYDGTRYDPASLHKYLYCGAEPVNAVDVSGLITIAEIKTRLWITANTVRYVAAHLLRQTMRVIYNKAKHYIVECLKQSVWFIADISNSRALSRPGQSAAATTQLEKALNADKKLFMNMNKNAPDVVATVMGGSKGVGSAGYVWHHGVSQFEMLLLQEACHKAYHK